MIPSSLKKPVLSKATSNVEDSGINTVENVSQNGDTTNNDESV